MGAYPEGQQDYDLLRSQPGEAKRAGRQIAAVELPRADPVMGEGGPVVERWS